MGYSALEVARHVINYANDNNIEMSNLKLQKILYFIQAQFILSSNRQRNCFDDKIEAWGFGPVVPSVYHEFKNHGSFNIPKVKQYVEVENDTWNVYLSDFKDNKISEQDKNVINQIIEGFKNYTANELVDITHRQGPWKDAYTIWGRNSEITTKAIGDYFIK